MTAESFESRVARHVALAASMEPRSDDRGELLSARRAPYSVVTLQWSRGRMTAERPSTTAETNPLNVLQWSRGRMTAERRTTTPMRYSLTIASMEPRSDDRGEFRRHRASGKVTEQLQWSRGRMTAERRSLRAG